MSGNRAVQAAQRRRAGPPETGRPGQSSTPQPSINSAQMFNQARPGNGPNIPNGRLAGQHVSLQQQQYQQQQQQQQHQEGLQSISKMTVAQAITLITLRLGAVESKLLNMPLDEHGHSGLDLGQGSGQSGIDSGFIQTILTRLDNLESMSSSTTFSPDLSLLHQTIESLSQSVNAIKKTQMVITKEHSQIKSLVDTLNQKIVETNVNMSSLQNLSIENNRKLLELSSSLGEIGDDYGDNFVSNGTDLDALNNLEYEELEPTSDGMGMGMSNNYSDIKQMVEAELHLST